MDLYNHQHIAKIGEWQASEIERRSEDVKRLGEGFLRLLVQRDICEQGKLTFSDLVLGANTAIKGPVDGAYIEYFLFHAASGGFVTESDEIDPRAGRQRISIELLTLEKNGIIKPTDGKAQYTHKDYHTA